MKLTLTEKKIIDQLDRNARLSGSQIAKKLNISPEAVNYNIRKLEQANIITGYITLTDFSTLGLTHYKFHLKLNHMNEKIRQEIVAYLKKNTYVKWLADCEGTFDINFSVRCKTIVEFEKLKSELFFKFDKYLHRKAIATISATETFSRGFILHKPKDSFTLYSGKKKISLSNDEIKILDAISSNCRQTIPNLSKELKITPRVIRYSIAQLEKKKVITGYKLALNYQKLGYLFFKLFVNLRSASPKRILSFKQYCSQHPNFTYWVKVISEWDMEHELEVESMSEFYSILKDIREKYSDIIQTMDWITITHEHKLVHA